MKWLTQYLNSNPAITQFVNNKGGFAHVTPIQEALLVLGYFKRTGKPLVIVKENEFQANALIESLKHLDDSLRVIFYNHEESMRVEAIVQSDIMQAGRVDALYAILDQAFDVCVTHAIASVRHISRVDVLREAMISLKVGQSVKMDAFARNLNHLGYKRVKYVEKPFTYSMRGGVCDVFSIQMERPLRIEFFDEDIDSLRYFDIETQRSFQKVEEARIVFASDVLLNQNQIAVITDEIDTHLEGASDILRDNLEMKRESLLQGDYDATLYPLLGYVDDLGSFFDFVKPYRIVISPLESIERMLESNEHDVAHYREEVLKMESGLFPLTVFKDFTTTLKNHEISTIHEFQADLEMDLPWHQANIVSDSLQESLQFIQREALSSKIIVALDEKNMEHFIETLINAAIPYKIVTDTPLENGLYLDYARLEQGFVLEDASIHVYTAFELYQFKRRKYRYDDKFSKAEVLNQLGDLNVGDYVVHRQHGIGRYMGIMTKEIEAIHKDFIRVLYKDNDELFVPLEQFSLVRKFSSAEGVGVRLSKLGTNTWQKNKERVEANVAIVADKLIDLYSKRVESQGFAFSPDTEYQKDFEQAFPYELTPDQKQAVIEIKKDMESHKPMDRLLIGDVGFGKTEVAIRAAFKAFVDRKQVIFLCPTTILSAQHYRTFKQRFEDYPIVVEVLNRFVTDKQQRDILQRFKQGKVDILVGTHRVLSHDVSAKDMGLLIIDEEQRFGVEHKEKIKTIKVSVDVLSLSATPIPRTLQMSLIGLRSLSQLNTPPSNRLPIMTYVVEKNQQMIYDIISKELNRGGQVFYLYNNVEQLYGVANNLSRNIAQAEVGIIHGQMDRHEIEDVMIRFIAKELNVLVCTTIIETGIDIPNANTILVDNAQRFGLSQLYQIKGRVGRSDRLAYAYFLVPSKKSLTEIASKRLQAIKEFTQLGSGYKIAMRDLTIRGAGELLGGNQSGFIDTVGIDLYVQLLKEAIDRRQGRVVETDTIVDRAIVNVDGYLPDSFVTDDGEKLELYQSIQAIATLASLKDFYQEIQDRYGVLPNAVTMLLEKKRFEILLEDARIESFKERAKSADVVFTEAYSQNVDGIKLFEIVSRVSTAIKIRYKQQKITLSVPMEPGWIQELLEVLESIEEK